MSARSIWVLLAFPLFLAACATPPDVQDMVASPEAVEGRPFPDALRENIAVVSVAGGEKTNPLWTSEINAEGLKSALVESLQAAGLHNAERSSAAYQLIAVILNVAQPLFGFDTTVTVTVDYRLLDGKTGKEDLSEALTSQYTATVGEAFYGVERLKMANEGAVRENIRMLLERLRTLDISP